MTMPGLERTFVLSSPQAAARLHAFLKANARAQAEAGKPLTVSVSEYHAKRSDDQNRKFHAMLRDLADTAWVGGKQFPADVWKEWIRCKFIGTEEFRLPDGKLIERGISTTTLSVSEFADLITKVQAWAATELGVELT